MKQEMLKKRKQGGWAMVETAAAITIGGIIVAGVFFMVNSAKSGNQAQTVASNVSDMAGKIQKNFSSRGSYDTLTATVINNMGLVAAPLTWSSTASKIQDPWGNAMTVTANAAGAVPSFAFTIGGSTAPLDKATCTDLATQLASGAISVNVGAASSTAGVISGGSVFKAAGGVPDPSALATGCSAANPVIAVQYS